MSWPKITNSADTQMRRCWEFGKLHLCWVRLWQTPWEAPYLCIAEIICGIDSTVDGNHPHINSLSSSALPEDIIFSHGDSLQDYGASERLNPVLADSKALWFLFDITSWNSCFRGRVALICFQSQSWPKLWCLPACSSQPVFISPPQSFTLPSLLASCCLLPVQDYVGSFTGPGTLVLPWFCQEGEQYPQIACLGTICLQLNWK